MKVFAIGSLNQPMTQEIRQTVMPREVPHTLAMHLDGIIEQFWLREGVGPVFLLNVDSVEAAKAAVADMPLVVEGLATYDFWPVGPLSPLRMLIAAK